MRKNEQFLWLWSSMPASKQTEKIVTSYFFQREQQLSAVLGNRFALDPLLSMKDRHKNRFGRFLVTECIGVTETNTCTCHRKWRSVFHNQLDGKRTFSGNGCEGNFHMGAHRTHPRQAQNEGEERQNQCENQDKIGQISIKENIK